MSINIEKTTGITEDSEQTASSIEEGYRDSTHEVLVHDVKTCLSSLSVGIGLAMEHLSDEDLEGLRRSISLLEGPDKLGALFSEHGKGEKLMSYMKSSLARLERRRKEAKDRLRAEQKRISEISAYLTLQLGNESAGCEHSFSLNQVIKNCVVLVQDRNPSADLLVDFVPSDHGDGPIEGSRVISTVLLNLLTNAKQALQSQPCEAPEITIRVKREEGEIVVYVEDNGPGISEAVVPRLFERGFSTKPEGTGLGLSQSRALADQRGWRLEFPSAQREKGARFALYIPATRST